MMKIKILPFFLVAALSAPGITLAETTDTTSQSMTQSLFSHVLLRDAKRVQAAAQQLQTALAAQPTDAPRSAAVDAAFAQLVRAWKAVQTAYVLGELDSDMIDTPQLIDTFHQGKENLNKKLTQVLASGETPRVALFKNSFKSINALAVFLYTDNTLSDTERAYADYTLAALLRHFSAIVSAYQAQAKAFDADQEQSTSFVLNALIDSAYKLKEWRVGDAAGLSRKYRGDADNRRQEYPLSGQSLAAMQAILAVHDDIMGQRDYANLGSAASQAGAKDAVALIRQLITQGQQQLQALQQEKIDDFKDKRFKPLFDTLNQLSDAYYQSLVQALPVQAKILDADGD